MKFIHCADLHLDAKLESNLSASKAKIRRAELLDSFRRMIEYGAELGVGVILIAGDLFDAERVSAKTRETVLAQMAGHPQITFLYLRGNHDGGFGQDDLPDNVKTFAAESSWVSYRFGQVVFTGTEHNGQTDIYDRLCCEAGDVNIAVMHGQESATASEPSQDTVCLKLLKNKNIDLLALGHIHSVKTGMLDKRGSYAYPGCLDGRGFDECGPKGFLLGEVTDGHVSETFVPFSSRILHYVSVDISGLVTYPDIERAVLDTVKDIPESDAVKAELAGAREPEARLDTEHLEATLGARFWFAKVKDGTVLAIKPEDYIGDVSLKGEFIRLVTSAKLAPEEKDRIITAGLRALRGEELDI